MYRLHYRELWCDPRRYWFGLGAMAGVVLIGLLSAFYMEHNGHWVTGMTNHVVWGIPHVFAIFLIVAASGALNVASIGSVFGGPMYKPLGRFSALLAIGLLAGGLMVLLLDLGRPDRLIVAMTTYNFKSIFAWNIILYTGFFAIVGAYLWSMMDRSVNHYYKPLGFAAFFWRLILTTGTGSIFGFLVAREAYDAAILAPMFIVMSFAYGLAFFIVALMAAYWWAERSIGDLRIAKLKNLLGVFIGGVFYFVAVYHLTNLYAARHADLSSFFLVSGGIYPLLFWFGYLILGTIVPLFLIYSPAFEKSRTAVLVAAVGTLIGGFALIYILLIGGQAYPMNLFPGKDVLESSMMDGQIARYVPTFAEFALGVAGVTVSMMMVAIASRMLKVLPDTLEDEAPAKS